MSQSRPFYRSKRLWLCFLSAPVVVVLSAWLIVWFDANQRLRTVRADSVPTNNEELERYYQLPAGVEDATEQWLAGINAVIDPYPWKDRPRRVDSLYAIGCVGEPWQFETECREIVRERAKGFDLLYAAAKSGGAIRFDTLVDEGFWREESGAYESLNAGTLLSMSAAISARDGRYEDAVRNIETILALAEALRFEVTMDANAQSSFYRMACVAIVRSAPEKWADENLRRLQDRLKKADFHDAWVRHANGDLAAVLEETRSEAPWYLRAINEREALKFFQTANEDKPKTWARKYEQHMQALLEIEELWYESELSKRVYQPFMGACLNEHAIMVHSSCETTCRCAIVVLAIARHRRRHGEFPVTIPDIDADLFSDGVPRDPWSPENTIRFKRSGEGVFTVYGVGRDEIDDGGQIVQPPEGGWVPDWGFAWKPVD